MKQVPSMDQWLKEAKADETAAKCGMYLVHNGVVREDAKAKVRGGDESAPQVTGMTFSYDKEKVDAAIEETYNMPGIYYIRTWLAEGELRRRHPAPRRRRAAVPRRDHQEHLRRRAGAPLNGGREAGPQHPSPLR